MRYFVRFSYFGKSYHGWQRQPNAVTVQQLLEEAYSTLLRKEVCLMGAGRTDAGVHAREMFAHYDLEKPVQGKDLIYRLNALLPDDIAVQEIRPVQAEAHARFDAVERSYEYRTIIKKDPFETDRAYYLKQVPDLGKMNEAAAMLLEFTDFKCFSKSNTDVKTYYCHLKKAVWTREDHMLIFSVTADRFLRNMVRAIVGTLLEVGLGSKGLEDVKGIIKSRDRSQAGVSVPAKGLYLTQVRYPDSLFL